MRQIAILGSTGSIGTQALDVIRNNPSLFRATVLTAHYNWEDLVRQAVEFLPDAVVIADESLYENVKKALADYPIAVHAGKKALSEAVTLPQIDIVLTALVGFAGLSPTIQAIKAGKHIALANKETLVVAGSIVMELASQHRVHILPVDSEHSAIFQCLEGEQHNPIEKIYLTASGGPFRGYSLDDLKTVTPAQALKHPNWEMGAKITIDSASMMNKGLEVIEAKWLFGLKDNQIDVIVHPQSIIHSIVQFEDGSMKAQMGLPDMRLPIQYALAYPQRIHNDFPRFNFLHFPNLTFEPINQKVFKNLALAYTAMRKGGIYPCVLNAANEVTNELFRKGQISFTAIGDLNEKAMQMTAAVENPRLEDLFEADKEARRFVAEAVRGQR